MINNILTLYRATSIMCGLIVSCIYTHLLPSALSILVGIEVILIILRDFNTLKQKQQTMLPKKLYGIFESFGILCIVLYCVLINSSIVPLLTTIFCIIAWYLFRINIIGYAQEFNYELFFQTLLVLIIATLGYGLFLTLSSNMPAGLNLAILCLLLLLPVNLYCWQNSDIITRLFVITTPILLIVATSILLYVKASLIHIYTCWIIIVQIVCLYSSSKILFKICYAAVCILIIAPLITILYVKYGSINAFFCPQTMGNIALSIKHENNEIINVISGIMNISCGNIFPINVLRNYGVIALLAFGALFLYILHSVYPRNKNIINRTTMQMVQRLKETISMRMAFFIIAGFLFIMQYNIFDVKFIFTIFAVSSLFSLINNNTNAR